jgi:tight adherence protein C
MLTIVPIFLFVVLISAAVLFTIFNKDVQIEHRVNALMKQKTSLLGGAVHADSARTKKKGNLSHRIKPYVERLKAETSEKMTADSKKSLERKLREAGYPFGWTPITFKLTQMGCGSALFLLVFFLGLTSGTQFLKLLFLSGTLALLGIRYPLFYLSKKKATRVKKIEKAMADFFDMVNLSIEAGMGVDGAILKACRQNQGPLADEFLQAIEDMKLGKSRREAFSDLRERVHSERFQSIMSAIIQADHLGIGMSNVLKSLTQRIRESQREIAREQAMKAPVKMMFPMVLFIFPSLFIVILGPLVVYFLTKGLGG